MRTEITDKGYTLYHMETKEDVEFLYNMRIALSTEWDRDYLTGVDKLMKWFEKLGAFFYKNNVKFYITDGTLLDEVYGFTDKVSYGNDCILISFTLNDMRKAYDVAVGKWKFGKPYGVNGCFWHRRKINDKRHTEEYYREQRLLGKEVY